MNRPTPTIDSIIAVAQHEHPQINEDVLRHAATIARNAHAGQKRLTGDPYIVHPLAAAETLAHLGVDTPTIAAGILHDVLEDTDVTRDELSDAVGEEITQLCEGVTKLEKFKYRGIERHVENLRKFFLAMAEDIRVVLIKLADRLHNMETIDPLPDHKQQRIARETMEIYVPIANRLGIAEIKGKLEDLAFPILDPDAYQWTKQQVTSRIAEREKYLETLKPKLMQALEREGITPRTVQARVKTYWSTYQKLKEKEMNIDQLHDLVAMRIIVETIEECYAVLGIVHALWPPVPGRIKDFIATPKPNGYQSLHTTVFSDAHQTEIQIRTQEMHNDAEHGIAAHWAYAEAGKPKDGIQVRGPRLEWIRQLREWQSEIEGTREFLESIKIDFFENRIFVFTPQGDIIDLPEGATPLDFAYQIHTDVGHHTAGARVDGKMTALDEPLQSGVVVEIITRNDARPSRDWLEMTQTNSAQSKIRRWLREHQKDVAAPDEQEKTEKKTPPPEPPTTAHSPTPAESVVLVEGEDNIETHMARCCNPLPGQAITGYATQRGTISIHRSACANLKRGNADRTLRAEWTEDAVQAETLCVTAEDRVGMLKEISAAISAVGLNISDIHTKPSRDAFATIEVTVLVGSAKHREELIRALRTIDGVVEIERA